MAGDESGLNAEVGITLTRMARQLAQLEGIVLKTMKRAESTITDSNARSADSFNRVKVAVDQMASPMQARIDALTGVTKKLGTSARESASAFDTFDSARAGVDRLRASIDPLFAASKRYETAVEQLNAAQRLGVINAQQYQQIMTRLDASHAGAIRSAGALRTGFSGVGNASGAARAQIQSMGHQIQDIAVQIAGGTSATRAFSQQLPQLASGFGPVGVLIGTLAAVGIPLLAMAFADAGEKSLTLEESVDALIASMGDYEEFMKRAATSTAVLSAEFGQFASQVQGFSEYLAGVTLSQTFDDLRATIEPLKGGLADFEKQLLGLADAKAQLAITPIDNPEAILFATEVIAIYQQAVEEAAAEMGVLPAQAEALLNAMNNLGNAKTMEQIASAAGEALSIIRDIAPAGFDIPEPLRQAAIALEEMQRQAAAAVTEVDNLAASGPRAGWMDPAIGETNMLIGRLIAAYDAAQALANINRQNLAGSLTYSGRGGDPRDFTTPTNPQSNTFGGSTYDPPKSRGGSGGGSSGKDSADILEQGQREIEQLQQQMDMLGKTTSEIARMTAEYELLNAAKQAGLDLDAMSATTGMTLRDSIAAQAQQIADLTIKYQQAKEQTEFYNDVQQQLQEGLVDAIVSGENFAGVLADVAKQLAKAFLQAALFGNGPLGGGSGILSGLFGGGGGTGGGFLAGLFKGFDQGGYTGNGGRLQPAGVVHKGEYVFDAVATRRIGVQQLSALHRGLKGYSNGGLVGSSPNVNVSTAAPRVEVVVIDSQEKFGEYLAANPRAEREVMKIVERNRT